MANTEPSTNLLEDIAVSSLPQVDVELSDRSPPVADASPPKPNVSEAKPIDSECVVDAKSQKDPSLKTPPEELIAQSQPDAHSGKMVIDGLQRQSSTEGATEDKAPRAAPESASAIRASEDTTMEDCAARDADREAKREVQCIGTTRQPSPRLDLPIVPLSNDKTEITEDSPIGEWRRVEDIITIVRGEDGILTIIMDAFQQPLELVRMEDNQWQARRMGSMDVIYDLTLRTKDSFEVRKDSRCCKIFRIKRSRSLLGDWSNLKGKGLSIFDTGGDYEIRGEGRPTLRLVRKKILDWEARRADNGVVVYLLEHAENSHRLIVRRPDAGSHGPPPLELTRSKGNRETPAPPLPPPLPPSLPLPPPPADRTQPPRPPSRRRGSPRGGRSSSQRAGSGAGGCPPSPRTHGKDYEEFTVGNALSSRVCEAMSKLSMREQRHIMGLDGGRNSFHLTGTVRDPSSVVMSRIKRLEREPLPASPVRESRSNSWRHRSRSSSGRGSSSSSYSGERHGSERSRSRPRR